MPGWACASATPAAPGLRLFHQGTPGGNRDWSEAGNILAQKPQDPRFHATVELTLEAMQVGDQAGLILVSGICGAIYLERTADGFELGQAALPARDSGMPRIIARQTWASPSVVLSLSQRDEACHFGYGEDAASTTPLGERIHPRDAGWMGARIGLFAFCLGTAPSGGSAVFSNFSYIPLP